MIGGLYIRKYGINRFHAGVAEAERTDCWVGLATTWELPCTAVEHNVGAKRTRFVYMYMKKDMSTLLVARPTNE